MFNKTELTEKLTAELRDIAKKEGIINADELRKNDLIEQILSKQSTTPQAVVAPLKEAKPKMVKDEPTEKPRKRVRIAAKEDSSAQVQPERITLFDEPQPPVIKEKVETPTTITVPPDFVDDPERLETIAVKLQNQAKKNKQPREEKQKQNND